MGCFPNKKKCSGADWLDPLIIFFRRCVNLNYELKKIIITLSVYLASINDLERNLKF